MVLRTNSWSAHTSRTKVCLMLECKQNFSYNAARWFIGMRPVSFDSLFSAFLCLSSVVGQIQNLFPSWK